MPSVCIVQSNWSSASQVAPGPVVKCTQPLVGCQRALCIALRTVLRRNCGFNLRTHQVVHHHVARNEPRALCMAEPLCILHWHSAVVHNKIRRVGWQVGWAGQERARMNEWMRTPSTPLHDVADVKAASTHARACSLSTALHRQPAGLHDGVVQNDTRMNACVRACVPPVAHG